VSAATYQSACYPTDTQAHTDPDSPYTYGTWHTKRQTLQQMYTDSEDTPSEAEDYHAKHSAPSHHNSQHVSPSLLTHLTLE